MGAQNKRKERREIKRNSEAEKLCFLLIQSPFAGAARYPDHVRKTAKCNCGTQEPQGFILVCFPVPGKETAAGFTPPA